MKMKYIVNVCLTEFEFTDGTTALTFAEIARNAVVGDLSVGIKLLKDETEETVDDISEAIDYDAYLKEEE